MAHTWNKEVAAKRGKDWTKKMVEGKLAHQLKPSALRLARLKASLNQEEVAKKNDLSSSTYGEVERGKRRVRPELADRIAKSVGKKTLDLFEKKGLKYVAKR